MKTEKAYSEYLFPQGFVFIFDLIKLNLGK